MILQWWLDKLEGNGEQQLPSPLCQKLPRESPHQSWAEWLHLGYWAGNMAHGDVSSVGKSKENM